MREIIWGWGEGARYQKGWEKLLHSDARKLPLDQSRDLIICTDSYINLYAISDY